MERPPVRMDDLPLSRFHCRIAGLTFGAHLTDGYVLGVIGYALIQLQPQMQLTPLQEGMIGGSALLGLFLGSLILGWIADHIGRQKIFTCSFVLITIASFLQFLVQTPEQLFWLRVAIGFGLGGDYSVGHTLLAEFSPRKYRGLLLGAFSVVWTLGYALASVIGHRVLEEGPEAWRWLLASTALPALWITLLRVGTPESPRWLMRKGRSREAHAVVARYLGPRVVLDDEPVCSDRRQHWGSLFTAPYWRRTLFNSLFFVCLVVPWFVIYTWLPAITSALGLKNGLLASMALNMLLIVGALFGLYLTQRFSRRGFLITGFALLTITLILMALVSQQAIPGFVSLFIVFTITISAVSNLVGILPAESFPTEIRSLGVGFATAMSRLGAALATGLLPLALNAWGLSMTMLLLAGVLIVGLIVSLLWAPETKDLPLASAAHNPATTKRAIDKLSPGV